MNIKIKNESPAYECIANEFSKGSVIRAGDKFYLVIVTDFGYRQFLDLETNLTLKVEAKLKRVGRRYKIADLTLEADD